MITLVAHLHSAAGVGSAVLRDVAAHLRSFEHLLCAPGQYLVSMPAATALVDESRTMLRIDFVVESEDAAARACAALTRELRAAVGDYGVTLSWMRSQTVATR